ncbi:hypothetical protein [Roseibium marinum]|uniref:Uncharacterized protein n=1 Tax=Roseibium marinum TaxID=281252 RepID=A0A2S3UT38_9HYPH|nr:hypothetical protein [Roseibium marinum]POF30856.1 hypothetical protein CLV41_10534 [Roseibium marinum]
MNAQGKASFENSYRGCSPQLLARTQQLWSARGLDHERIWRRSIGSLNSFRPFRVSEFNVNSAPMDAFLLFDQALIWVAALHAAACRSDTLPETRLSREQWLSVRAVTFRLMEQLDGIRLLFFADLPIPAMQIARSISEDADMVLAFLVRRKLAQRFTNCSSVEETTDFWRRHIAGGRAYRVVTEQLYSVGLDYGSDGAYSDWRRSTVATLGAAAHTSFHWHLMRDASPGFEPLFRQTGDCLDFVTLRLQEMCAYSSVLQDRLQEDLVSLRKQAAGDPNPDILAASAAVIGEITVNQWRRSVTEDATG